MPADHLPADVLSAPRRPEPAALQAALLPAAALVPVASTVVAVALPAIIADLATGTAAIGWLVSGYLVLVAVLQLPAGRLGDELGHRRVLLAGTGLMAVASAAAASSPAAAPLVAARLLQGVAGALVVPNVLAVIRREVAEGERDRSVGAFLAVMAAGSVLGVVGGGFLVALGGWRAAFGGVAVLALGTLVGLGALGAAPAPGGRARSPAPDPRGSWEAERSGRGPALVRCAGGIALTNLALYVVLLVVPLHLEALGWSAGAAGALLGAFVGASALGALLAARLARWVGRERAVVAAHVVAGGALLALPAVPGGAAWLLPALSGGGLGLGVAMSLWLGRGVDAAGAETAGATSGLLFASRYAGSILGSALLPTILGSVGHAGALRLAATASLTATLVGAASLRLPRERARGT